MASSRPVKTAAQANANWKSAMASPQASQKYTQGVQSVTVSPNQTAASPAAIAKYQASTAAAVASGRLQSANQAVPLQKWQQAAAAGAARLATGAANGAANHMAAATKMAAGWQQARDAAAAIPHDGSLMAAQAKVMAAMTAMRQAAGKGQS